MRHRLALVSWLTILWIGLWGDPSWANLIGGAAVATAVVVAFTPSQPVGLRIHPIHLIRFGAHFLANLVSSSFDVAVIVLRPRPDIDTAVIAVPIASTTRGVTLVIAAAISLTPGTLVIDTSNEPDRTVLYIHVLHLRDRARAVAEIARLEQLATAAFGVQPTPADLPHPGGAK